MKELRSIAIIAIIVAGCAHAPVAGPVTTPNGAIYVDDGGRGGLPVVFIHGNGADSTNWESQLAHLRPARRAVAVDLPGMGRSAPAANGDYSPKANAAAVDAAMSAIGLKRFVLVGHSYGGAVAATYAAAHPEKVAAVIYADSAASVPAMSPPMQKFIDALRADRMKVTRMWFAPMLKPSSPAVQDRVFATVEKSKVDAFAGALEKLAGYDAKAVVNAYPGPKFVIYAADIESPASFHPQFPDLPAEKITGAGHWLMLDKPQEFNAALDKFLAQVR
ncbi:MAG TPA: alpha/beta hydrolase [Thermoanaerobaculia bacterium]|jgi:pimeloyl-ACP methyl ester carboxylesterase|nr:alpha/beta hydrolase [Thermoanaerobaculia bacterium]